MKDLFVADNFIDDTICNEMLNVCKNLVPNMEQIKDGRKILRNSNNLEVKNFLSKVMPKISSLLNNKYYVERVWLSVMETNSHLAPHIDNEGENSKKSLAVLFYLNDDFEGGELYFTNLNKVIKPKKGGLVLFPCNIEKFLHGVSTITKGTRYAIPLEITLNEKLKLYDI